MIWSAFNRHRTVSLPQLALESERMTTVRGPSALTFPFCSIQLPARGDSPSNALPCAVAGMGSKAVRSRTRSRGFRRMKPRLYLGSLAPIYHQRESQFG